MTAHHRARFEQLQAQLQPQWQTIFNDPLAPRTVVIAPSLTFPEEELHKIDGVHRYEERLLCLLLLLKLPRTQVLYLSSEAVDPVIVDYYLHLLRGVPSGHARRRLKLISCGDASPEPLTQKLLRRPRLLGRIRAAIDHPDAAHLTCFNATALEQELAVALNLPLYACDPALSHLGSKSGSREVFRAAGVALPPGVENLDEFSDVAEALAGLRLDDDGLHKAVVKLNEGFSGEGNAMFSFEGCPQGPGTSLLDLKTWVVAELPRRLKFEAATERFEPFMHKMKEGQGVVEAFIRGRDKCSPSVQARIDPTGKPEVISTHDQVLGGPSGQIFLGCTFPAAAGYRQSLAAQGQRVADELARRGALGRFSVDFVTVKDAQGDWHHAAIEINLRKGGTTHTFIMLEYLTDGVFDPERGELLLPSGEPRVYYATDNLQSEAYRSLTSEDLIDIAVCEGLHFQSSTNEGVTFHLLGAMAQHGKLGLVSIAPNMERAQAQYRRAVEVIDRAAAQPSSGKQRA